MTRIFTAAAAAALALSMGVASAQEENTWDVDDDGGVTMEAFNTGFDSTGRYDAWDTDKDGMLSREEFNAGVYTYYDADSDGYWNADELSTMNNDAIWSGMEKAGDAGNN